MDYARITIQRRVEWIDTDAAGIFHWTTVFRMAEAAEAALHTSLGIADRTFGVSPRVRIECDFRASAEFNDLLDVNLAVRKVGRTSLVQGFRISRGKVLIAEGEMTICLIDRVTQKATPWPEDMRTLLEMSGERREELP
jgi:acyl-CoA thioester hydrolase